MSQTMATTKAPRAILRYSESTVTWTEILLPPWARRASVTPLGNAIECIASLEPGVDDGDTTTGSENFEDIGANDKYDIVLTAGRGNDPQCRLFVRALSTHVITVVCEESEAG